MQPTRREFLKVGTAALLSTAAGCERVPEFLISGSAKSELGPFRPPTSDEIDLIAHYLNRLSFGSRPGDYDRVRRLGTTVEDAVAAYLEEQLHPEKIDDDTGDRAVRRLETLRETRGGLFEYHPHVLLRELVHGTLLRAVYSKRQLYEVMVQFWSDHFNIDPSKGDCQWLKVWDDREVIRKYALGCTRGAPASSLPDILRQFLPGASRSSPEPTGKFADMVRASALSPAMLWYLDGRENRKSNPADKPNENYARELLELHTLGVHGGYTQQDVMEVARCLTGWSVRALRRGQLNFQVGKVEFKRHLHDDGSKVVLGRKIPPGLGERDLDRVLDIISLHPATAQHLAVKLCRRFIADDPPAGAAETVARAFLKSEGDIRETLRALFGTEEYRSARGVKLKRPFHFVVSALRATDANVARVPDRRNDGPLLEYLRRMGHAPFDYPTPDGYPEEAAPWTGTLLWRWKFALALSENHIHEAKVDPASLERKFGSAEALAAAFLGRKPRPEEIQAYHQSGAGAALLLASPAFQSC